MVRILIVDDAQFMRNILKKIFTSKGYEVIGEADTADAGVQAYKEQHPDVVTMDICMPNKSGIEAIKDIYDIDPKAKVLAELVTSEPQLASFLCQRLKQISEI